MRISKGLAVCLCVTVMMLLIVPAWVSAGEEGVKLNAPENGKELLPLGLEGRCPVAVIENDKWVKGDPELVATFDGWRYFLSNKDAKRMFLDDPIKFVPVLGGDCIVAFQRTGERVAGTIAYHTVHDGRLYLFENGEHKDIFKAEPETFVAVDLAIDGSCPVCLTNMKMKMPGKPEFLAVHKGLRYFLGAAEHREWFLADPEKFLKAGEVKEKVKEIEEKVKEKIEKKPEGDSGTK